MGPVRPHPAILSLLVVLAGCAAQKTTLDSLPKVLPVQVQREWRLHDAVTQPMDALPADYRHLGAKTWVLAHYQANGTVTVRLLELKPGTAFEAMQKWHSPTSLGFFKEDYFGTVESDRLSREELAGFVQDLQQNLKSRAE
jgi:hypothetical protein